MQRPTGVIAVVAVFTIAAAYLWGIGTLMLATPGAVSMKLGAPLLHGLELAGPFMFLLGGALAALIGWGLWRMKNWARLSALAILVAGTGLMLPTVSAAVATLGWALVWSGLSVIVRVMMVWYLWQESVAELFRQVKGR